MIVFAGFANDLQRLLVTAFSAKRFALSLRYIYGDCQYYFIIIASGVEIRTSAAIVFTDFAIVMRRLSVTAFSAKQFALSL